MSSISLEKRSEKVGAILLTKGVKTAPIMRVGLALDISMSMSSIISRGTLQNAVDQLMGVAVKFDDNGELDVFKFDTECEYVGTATPSNYENYVKKNGISARGGTAYGPIVNEAVKFFFQGNGAPAKKVGGFFGFGGKTVAASPAGDTSPVLMMILTDGEPGDRGDSLTRIFRNAEQHNIYFHLVGIGGTRSSFPTIARLADDLDNVGEVYLPRLDMSDDEIYQQIICDELVGWIKTNQSGATATA